MISPAANCFCFFFVEHSILKSPTLVILDKLFPSALAVLRTGWGEKLIRRDRAAPYINNQRSSSYSAAIPLLRGQRLRAASLLLRGHRGQSRFSGFTATTGGVTGVTASLRLLRGHGRFAVLGSRGHGGSFDPVIPRKKLLLLILAFVLRSCKLFIPVITRVSPWKRVLVVIFLDYLMFLLWFHL